MINIITELEKYLLHEGKSIAVRKYTLMLKRAERELERISVNAPKAEIIIDQLRVVIAGYRSVLAAVTALNPDMYPANNPLYRDGPKAVKEKAVSKKIEAPVEPAPAIDVMETETQPGPNGALHIKKTKPLKQSTANGKWDKQKEEFLLKNHENLSPRRIAKHLGLSASTIIYHLKRLGLRDNLSDHISGGEVDA